MDANYPQGFWNETVRSGVRCGAFETIKWLHEIRNDGCTPETPFSAAKCGDLEIVKLLYENRDDLKVCESMSLHSHISIRTKMFMNGYLNNVYTSTCA